MRRIAKYKLWPIFQSTFIIIALILAFKVLAFSEIFYKFQAILLCVLFIYFAFCLSNYLLKKKHFDKVEGYYFLLIILAPIYSAYVANVSIDQSIDYGILAQRDWLLVMLSLWFSHMLVKGKITFVTFEKIFVFMAWASLICYVIFIFLYETNRISDYYSFITENSTRGLRPKFQSYFITYGVIYYMSRFYILKNKQDLIASIIFLSYIFFVIKGRADILMIMGTLILFFWFNYRGRKMVVAINGLYFLLLFGILLYLFHPEYFNLMGYLFEQMIDVLLGKESQDMSANARIHETKIVLEYFRSHPLSIVFGLGKISNQWNYGYSSLFGYFYPSDIGILGGIFLYGIIGLLAICLIPAFISMKVIRRTRTGGNAFILSLKYVLIFSLIRMAQGGFYFRVVDYVIPLFILIAYEKMNICYAKKRMQQQSNPLYYSQL